MTAWAKIEASLPDSVNGLSYNVLGNGRIVAEGVMVSSRVNVERRRFTLAHELAHREIRSAGDRATGLEKAMDRFAGAFLIPAQPLREAVGHTRHRVTYCEVMRLKHKYGVSAATVLLSLCQVGVLSESNVRHGFVTHAGTWRKFEPDPLGENHGFAAYEKLLRFERLVLRAVGEKLVSPIRAAGLLKQPLAIVERKISGPTIH